MTPNFLDWQPIATVPHDRRVVLVEDGHIWSDRFVGSGHGYWDVAPDANPTDWAEMPPLPEPTEAEAGA